VIELIDGHEEMDRESGPSFHLFMQGEDDLIFADSGDLGTVEKSSGDDIKNLPRLGSKDASEVLGLVPNERRRGAFVVPCICDPSATSHIDVECIAFARGLCDVIKGAWILAENTTGSALSAPRLCCLFCFAFAEKRCFDLPLSILPE